MGSGKDCIFCKIIKKEIPAKIVYENDHVVAFHDLHPQAPTHILFIPKVHADSLAHLPEEKMSALSEVFLAVQKVGRQQGFLEKGFRTIINTGRDGGQTVFHLHVHILAGTKFKEEL